MRHVRAAWLARSTSASSTSAGSTTAGSTAAGSTAAGSTSTGSTTAGATTAGGGVADRCGRMPAEPSSSGGGGGGGGGSSKAAFKRAVLFASLGIGEAGRVRALVSAALFGRAGTAVADAQAPPWRLRFGLAAQLSSRLHHRFKSK